ncbi:ribonuclease HI family protein [Candidatus Babeliales bacterium]|nr:ribonuclease HI family protein [Candidatus Babeliales bacterium]
MTKQSSIFDYLFGPSETAGSQWELRVDGACRGNPGSSGAGVYIKKDGQDFIKKGFYLGKGTNNRAEYLAFLIGVFYLKKEMKKEDSVILMSDSQLVIRQLEGIYCIKNVHLKVFYTAICNELSSLKHSFKHIEREYNTVADMLANQGVDSKTSLPLKFLDTLQSYGIYL